MSTADRQRIQQAVRAAERGTSAEFVTVLARRSDGYLFESLFVASVASSVALALPAILWFVGWPGSIPRLVGIQLGAFAILGLLLRWPVVTMALVPAAVQVAHARRLAREQFFTLGLSNTAERTGVLLFVSLAERYVEILADKGVHGRVGEEAWQRIVTDFTADVRAGRAADGFVRAIEALGAQLARHCPPAAGNPNERTDALVEIP
jgi:putative membrane protein